MIYSKVNEDQRAARIECIEFSEDKVAELLSQLRQLESEPEELVNLFEAAAVRFGSLPFWAYYMAASAYYSLGQGSACLSAAMNAINLQPEFHNWHPYFNIFQYFYSEKRYADALFILEKQLRLDPMNPVAPLWQFLELKRQLGFPLEDYDLFTREHVNVVPIRDASEFSPFHFGEYGEGSALVLQRLKGHLQIPQIYISYIENAEVWTYGGNLLIFCDGRIVKDCCISQYPEFVEPHARKAMLESSEPIKSAPTGVFIGDLYKTANVCHFLLDSLTRLALYEELGVDIQRAAVFGAELSQEYQHSMLATVGVENYVDMTKTSRWFVDRLWVSANCQPAFCHPAHFGSKWAIDFLRTKFGVFDGCSSTSRLYISRDDASVRRIRNEAEVVALLEKYGFRKIVARDYGYKEQVEMFKNASHVIGMHGAGLTNIVFAPRSAHVLEIMHALGGTAAYAITAAGVGLNYSVFVGKDPDSDEDAFSDAALLRDGLLGFGGAPALGNRDVIVDLDKLLIWLEDVGLKP